MNTLPLITLGIPIYNAAGLIERTLLSALNQTYPNIEFIFVDDKGDSMDIVRRVAGEHPRGSAVRIIDQVVNQGTGAARNTIVEKATGVSAPCRLYRDLTSFQQGFDAHSSSCPSCAEAIGLLPPRNRTQAKSCTMKGTE